MQHIDSSVRVKKYRVTCWRTHYGFYDVEAKNEKEAEAKAYQNLWNGQDLDERTDMDAGISKTEEV